MDRKLAQKPKIGIIAGDPAGIGPEIIAKALPACRGRYQPVLIGSSALLTDAIRHYAPDWNIRQARWVDVALEGPVVPGTISAGSGQATDRSIRQAIRLAQTGEVDGLALAPITKQALRLAGVGYDSEFEVLAREFQVQDVKAVVRAGNIFRCTVVGHCPFREIASRLTTAGIVQTARQLAAVMARYGCLERGIAVAALNPHAGEGGLFGDEEARIIEPAIQALRQNDLKVIGPVPADTVFLKAKNGEVGGLVYLYHDQGNIAMKSCCFGDSVLIYTQVPCPVVSVGHGSALDIAGQGTADPHNMIACLETLWAMLQGGPDDV